jgi:hypothetical protein
MKALVVLLLVAASPPKQFNLECAGTVEILGLSGVTASSYTRTIRIDLTANQWCADECSKVDQIASVEPNRLLLRDIKQDTARNYWAESEAVDRTTAEHSSMARNDPMGPAPRSAFSKGKCILKPFTGFGSEKRQF